MLYMLLTCLPLIPLRVLLSAPQTLLSTLYTFHLHYLRYLCLFILIPSLPCPLTLTFYRYTPRSKYKPWRDTFVGLRPPLSNCVLRNLDLRNLDIRNHGNGTIESTLR
jgi:hypothetical protein